jgi:uncharacterized protein DUF3429
MNQRLPNVAILLGLLTLVPFIVLALAEMGSAPGSALRPLGILMAYGGVVLAFFGGVHWGFALQEGAQGPEPTPPDSTRPDSKGSGSTGFEATRVERARLLLGIVPALIAWVALLLLYVAPAELGLAVLIVGYIAAIAGEDQGKRRGLVPRGYMWLRWGMSIVIVALLTTVLVVRLLGARVVF